MASTSIGRHARVGRSDDHLGKIDRAHTSPSDGAGHRFAARLLRASSREGPRRRARSPSFAAIGAAVREKGVDRYLSGLSASITTRDRLRLRDSLRHRSQISPSGVSSISSSPPPEQAEPLADLRGQDYSSIWSDIEMICHERPRKSICANIRYAMDLVHVTWDEI